MSADQLKNEEPQLIPIRVRKPEDIGPLPVEIDRSWKQRCDHGPPVVDPKARRVHCQKCGVELDPIDCLVKIANEGLRLERHVEEINKDRERKERVASEKTARNRESAQRRIGSLQVGQFIRVTYTHNNGSEAMTSGTFERIDGDALVLRQDGYPHVATVKVETIVGIRRCPKRDRRKENRNA